MLNGKNPIFTPINVGIDRTVSLFTGYGLHKGFCCMYCITRDIETIVQITLRS